MRSERVSFATCLSWVLWHGARLPAHGEARPGSVRCLASTQGKVPAGRAARLGMGRGVGHYLALPLDKALARLTGSARDLEDLVRGLETLAPDLRFCV